jgi:hypothetical protein
MRRFAAAVVFVALTLPSVAFAQDDGAKRDAQARFEEGMKRVRGGDFEGGRLAFVQAYAVLKNPDILWNLALSELKSSHPLEALEHFKVYAVDPKVADAERESAKKYIADASSKTGHIAVDAPAGSEIVVDGKKWNAFAPLKEPLDVTPGKHSVEARLGGKGSSVEVFAAAGQESSAMFRAEDMRVSVATSTAAPAQGPDAVTPPKEETHASSAKWITVGALGVGALIAGGVGVGFLAGAGSQQTKADSAKAQLPAGSFGCAGVTTGPCQDLATANDAHSSDQGAAIGFLIGGGVLAAAAIGALVFWPKSSKAASAWIAPSAGPHGASVSIGTTF